MIPMASGLGEAGDQTSPLGRAVVGGLIASTFAALFILPLVFAWGHGKDGHGIRIAGSRRMKRVSNIWLQRAPQLRITAYSHS